MMDKVKAISYLSGMKDDGSRHIFLPFTVSILCHLFFISVLIFVPGLNMPSRLPYSVIHVNMVTLPAKGSSMSTRNLSTLTPSAEKTTSKEQGVSFKAVSVAPQKKAKTSLEKNPETDSSKMKSAIEQMKDKAETSRPSDVTEAIERIRNRVKETDANQMTVQHTDNELVGVEDGVPGGSGVGGHSPLDILTLYTYEIRDRVQQNWAYSESLAGAEPDLQTHLVFEVLPNGDIRDIWFTEKSGNKYLDESAYKAVIKSKPFPPHPRELSRPMVTVPLRFTPKGLQK